MIKRKPRKVPLIDSLDEIRKLLVSRFKSARAETGEELRSVANAPIHNEENS